MVQQEGMTPQLQVRRLAHSVLKEPEEPEEPEKMLAIAEEIYMWAVPRQGLELQKAM